MADVSRNTSKERIHKIQFKGEDYSGSSSPIPDKKRTKDEDEQEDQEEEKKQERSRDKGKYLRALLSFFALINSVIVQTSIKVMKRLKNYNPEPEVKITVNPAANINKSNPTKKPNVGLNNISKPSTTRVGPDFRMR